MTESLLASTVTFAAYFALMLGIGLWTYRRTTSASDFFLGGRTLNSWVSGLSANASDFSGWLLLGLPGAIYLSGLGEAWIAVGLAVGFYASWRVVAPRLRVYTERATDARRGGESDSLTLSSFLENRFGERRGVLRGVSALLILVFYLFYVASGLVAMAVLFDQVFDLPGTAAVVLGASVVVLYTFLGGFLAVSFTDVVQAAMMWLALLAVSAAALVALGGFGGVADGVAARSDALFSAFGGVALSDGAWQPTERLGVLVIVSGLAWGLGYFGQPHILARFMGIRSVAHIPRARLVSVAWAVTAMALAVFVGFVGIAYFDQPLDNPESVYLSLIQALTNPWVGGLLLSAVLAAVMSTADSQLLVAAAALTEDGYRVLTRREVSPAAMVWISRVAVVGVALAAGVLAVASQDSVLELVGYAWAGFGAAFGPVVVLALYWRRMNWVGALAGMVAGGTVALVWPNVDPIGLYAMVPAVFAAVVAVFVCNPLGPKASEQMAADFRRVEEVTGRA
ncbi:sodium/proline symporter PutP [Thermobifida cellulosilytica]|uniref:Sodium/proline symporter n=1 Tax=Thermobifida cellulosilytica TB100 TaxID=665004 RepID=A0A147KEM9_THECS|nr:sodium/proline symporter PutP [Thermobifida cellulosilytica]KUP95752.1 proline:sodium symporter [Thermobifida cellulosilytica TB100]